LVKLLAQTNLSPGKSQPQKKKLLLAPGGLKPPGLAAAKPPG